MPLRTRLVARRVAAPSTHPRTTGAAPSQRATSPLALGWSSSHCLPSSSTRIAQGSELTRPRATRVEARGGSIDKSTDAGAYVLKARHLRDLTVTIESVHAGAACRLEPTPTPRASPACSCSVVSDHRRATLDVSGGHDRKAAIPRRTRITTTITPVLSAVIFQPQLQRRTSPTRRPPSAG